MKKTVENEFSDYVLDRNAAARLLKVSVRTLDRYLKSDRLSCAKDDGRIWLSKEEICAFKGARDERRARRILDISNAGLSVENSQNYVDVNSRELSSHARGEDLNVVESVYKVLYEESKQQLDEQQKRLEGANYRVGQLEAELKNTVPMLEFQQKQVYYLETSEDMKQRLEKVSQKLQEAQKQYQVEKYNKLIYLVILLGILALQPLWLMLTGAR